MRTGQEIENETRQALVDYIGVTPTAVARGTTFEQQLGMDDLDRIEFAMEVEDRLGIFIPDELALEALTFGEFVDGVEKACR